jgi:hypothetical protein
VPVILATRGAVVGARGWRIARQAAGDVLAPAPGFPNMPFGLSGAVTFSSPPKRTSGLAPFSWTVESLGSGYLV